MNDIDFEKEFAHFNKVYHYTSRQQLILDDANITVTATGHDYDALAIVENKTQSKIIIDFYDYEESITIKPNDYCLLLNDAAGRAQVSQFASGNYQVHYEEVQR